MSEILAVVPEEGIVDTGCISFMFLVNADVPRTKLGRPFGFLWRHAKSEDYLDPFKLVRGEAGAVGDDGTPRWAANLWRHGELVLASGVDSIEGEPGLQELLENLPDCALLVPPADIEPIEFACQGLGHTLDVVRHEGRLATS